MSAKHDAASAIIDVMKVHHNQVNITQLVGFTRLPLNTVKNAVDFLQINGYIRSPRMRAWVLTEKGHAVDPRVGVHKYANPQRPTPGVSKAARQQGATGLRGAAWRALRFFNDTAADEIYTLVDGSYGENAAVRVRVIYYFASLARYGVIASKQERRGTSKRLYILINNLGPLAPTVSTRGHAHDPNSGQFLTIVGPGEATQ